MITNCGAPNATASLVFDVTVAPPSPGFLYWALGANGQNPVVAVEVGNGTLIGPPGTLAGVPLVPASQGDLVSIFYYVPGSQISPSSVMIGGQFADIISLGAAPLNSGPSQINVIIPHGLTPGNQPIVLTVNGASSPTGAYIDVGK